MATPRPRLLTQINSLKLNWYRHLWNGVSTWQIVPWSAKTSRLIGIWSSMRVIELVLPGIWPTALSNAEVTSRLLYDKKLLPEFSQFEIPWAASDATI